MDGLLPDFSPFLVGDGAVGFGKSLAEEFPPSNENPLFLFPTLIGLRRLVPPPKSLSFGLFS